MVEYKKERHILNEYLVPERYSEVLPPYFDGSKRTIGIGDKIDLANVVQKRLDQKTISSSKDVLGIE